MKCSTIERYDSVGNPIYKEKKRFSTLDEAIEAAKKMNARGSRIHKIVAYRCDYCGKYHTGKNKHLLKKKDIEKYRKELGL